MISAFKKQLEHPKPNFKVIYPNGRFLVSELQRAKKGHKIIANFNPFDDRLTPYEMEFEVSESSSDGFKLKNLDEVFLFSQFNDLHEFMDNKGTFTFWPVEN